MQQFVSLQRVILGFVFQPPFLGTEYIVASYGDMCDMYPGLTFPSLSGCTGVFDNTVTFKVGGNAVTKTASGSTPGQTETWVINKGDVVMVSSAGAEADLTGSRWSADKPIAVVFQVINVQIFLQAIDGAIIPVKWTFLHINGEPIISSEDYNPESMLLSCVYLLNNPLLMPIIKEIISEHLQIFPD